MYYFIIIIIIIIIAMAPINPRTAVICIANDPI